MSYYDEKPATVVGIKLLKNSLELRLDVPLSRTDARNARKIIRVMGKAGFFRLMRDYDSWNSTKHELALWSDDIVLANLIMQQACDQCEGEWNDLGDLSFDENLSARLSEEESPNPKLHRQACIHFRRAANHALKHRRLAAVKSARAAFKLWKLPINKRSKKED